MCCCRGGSFAAIGGGRYRHSRPHHPLRSTSLIAENGPVHWAHMLPAAGPVETHKYKRGHLVVFSGEADQDGRRPHVGNGGLKAGAGLVTIASPRAASRVNAGAHLTAIMLHAVDTRRISGWLRDESAADLRSWARLSASARRHGVSSLRFDSERHLCSMPTASPRFGTTRRVVRSLSQGEPRLVLTPHEGEFAPSLSRYCR
jgi:hypothetical protein